MIATYQINEEDFAMRVCVKGKHVGDIKKPNAHFFFYPKHNFWNDSIILEQTMAASKNKLEQFFENIIELAKQLQ